MSVHTPSTKYLCHLLEIEANKKNTDHGVARDSSLELRASEQGQGRQRYVVSSTYRCRKKYTGEKYTGELLATQTLHRLRKTERQLADTKFSRRILNMLLGNIE